MLRLTSRRPLQRAAPAALRAQSTSSPTQPQPPSTPAAEPSLTSVPPDTPTDLPSVVQAQPVLTADVLSGAPPELRHRLVRIFRPTPTTMQSGGSRNDGWRLDWDVALGGGRWENPLMGWASSADYMQGTRMKFTTKEDAMRFAEKQGWDYYVQTEGAKRIPPKNYSENYVYRPNALRIARTK